ncbi:ATP-binding protein [Streptomyces qinzhouensis]|uniref:ATP-binding protein n=1 Tax=Streptomyces qinzhouensis TaxID=2599401 RepID=A0A5B8JK30_9ACTN|nr:ATP-binding protein [Streptomyces qinzhouensis]
MPVTLSRGVPTAVVSAPRPPTARHAAVFECHNPADGEEVRPQDARRVSQIRRIGRAALRKWGFHGAVDDAELIISELVTNAIENGSGCSVGFSISCVGTTVRIEVADGSHSRPQVRRRGGLYEEGGRGLVLIEHLASAWGTSEDGTRTWCELQLGEDLEGEPS